MRKSVLFIATLAVLGLFAGGASATKLTEQQVKNTCGGSLQTGGVPGTTASGCEKKCGDKVCTYNCCSGKACGEQGCHGHVVNLTTGGGKTKGPLPAATMKEIRAMSVTKKMDVSSPTLMMNNNTMKTDSKTLKQDNTLTNRSNTLQGSTGSKLNKQMDSTTTQKR